MGARSFHGGRRTAVRALAAAVVSSALAGAAWAAERVALVIGNSARERVRPLENLGNGARAVGDAFESPGYSVTRLMDADHGALRKGLRSFEEAARATGTTMPVSGLPARSAAGAGGPAGPPGAPVSVQGQS